MQCVLAAIDCIFAEPDGIAAHPRFQNWEIRELIVVVYVHLLAANTSIVLRLLPS